MSVGGSFDRSTIMRVLFDVYGDNDLVRELLDIVVCPRMCQWMIIRETRSKRVPVVPRQILRCAKLAKLVLK